jgi:hypothetical protein
MKETGVTISNDGTGSSVVKMKNIIFGNDF